MPKATDRIQDAKPYVKRALQDEELRDNLRSAFATARDVYDELLGNRGVTGIATKVASDEDIQDQLRSAIQPRATRAATARCCWPASSSGSCLTRSPGPRPGAG